MTTKVAVGINKQVDKDGYAAPSSFHHISALHVDYRNNYYSVTIDSYFNQSYCDNHRPPTCSASYQIHNPPEKGADINLWSLQSLIAAEGDSNPLSGGEIAYSDAAAA